MTYSAAVPALAEKKTKQPLQSENLANYCSPSVPADLPSEHRYDLIMYCCVQQYCYWYLLLSSFYKSARIPGTTSLLLRYSSAAAVVRCKRRHNQPTAVVVVVAVVSKRAYTLVNFTIIIYRNQNPHGPRIPHT